MSDDLEARVARLEAENAVRNLKMDYARLCDAGYPPGPISELFVLDGVWDGGDSFGRHEGKQAIADFFAVSGDRVPFALHYTIAGRIELDDSGNSARGTWYLWQPMTLEGTALWLMATYDDRYVLTPEGWRYESLTLDVKAMTPVRKDWIEQQFAG